MSQKQILEVREISKYDRKGETPSYLYEKISFTLQKGEVISIIHKAEEIRAIFIESLIGLQDVDRGLIYFLGKNLAEILGNERDNLYKDKIKYIKRINNLFDFLTVNEHIELVQKQNFEIDLSELFPEIEGLRRVGINSLSPLDYQILNLYITLMFDPVLIVMNDPGIYLKNDEQDHLFKKIKKISKSTGISFILSTPDTTGLSIFNKTIKI
jgi:ABC-type branched-subunit amino acid transport system ATPase component